MKNHRIFYLFSLFHFILRNYILTIYDRKKLHDFIFIGVQDM